MSAALELARAEHRDAVAAFVARARALGPDQWTAPVADGKWSPGEITEHVRMTYDVLRAELETGHGLRLRTPAWLRPWLRLRYLSRILRFGRIPVAVMAPREVRPAPGPYPQQETLAALERAAGAIETAIAERWERRGAVLTHHLFGRLSMPQAMRFLTVHTTHHATQLPGAPSA